MLIIRFFHFLKGYLRIEINGLYQERFLNICARRGIYLWDLRRTGGSKTTASIGIASFRKLLPIAYKSKCRPRILARKGLPFYINKYRKRYALVGGLFACVALVYYLTTFLWYVEVSGNQRIQSEQLVAALEKAGLTVGMKLKRIDPYEIERAIMLDSDDLVWIAVNLKGTVAYVEIIESKLAPEIIPTDEPCDIISARYGVIASIDVKHGDQIVEVNDIVQKGQLLVSGTTDKGMSGIKLVHAQAQVKAYTWHEKSMEVSMTEPVKRLTGNKIKQYEFKILNFLQKFYKNDSIPYQNYDKIIDERKLTLGNDFVLPVSITTTTYYEFENKYRKLSQTEALDKALKQIYSEMDEQTQDMQVLDRSYTLTEMEDGTLKLNVVYCCLEDISVQRAIQVTDVTEQTEQPDVQTEQPDVAD